MWFSLGFITRETGFMKFRQLMCFGALGRVPSTISPTTRGKFCNPSSPRIFQVQDQEILQLSGLSGLSWSYLGALPRTLALRLEAIFQFPGLEPTILLLCPRMLFSWFRTRELGLYGTKAGSMFWSLGKNSFFKPWGKASVSIIFVYDNLLTNLVVLWSCGCSFF